MKGVFLGNICWHPTSVAPKIAQNLHIIEENAPLTVSDLQMKMRSHKTCLKEIIKLFSTLRIMGMLFKKGFCTTYGF